MVYHEDFGKTQTLNSTLAILAWRPTRFEVVVDNGRSDLIEVLEGVDNLHDDGAALLL